MLRDEHKEQDLGSIVILRETKDLARPWPHRPGHRFIAEGAQDAIMSCGASTALCYSCSDIPSLAKGDDGEFLGLDSVSCPPVATGHSIFLL